MGQTGPLRDLGPCEVWWGVSVAVPTPVKVGETEGGVKFNFKTGSAAIKEDAKGIAPVDHVTTGIETCQITAPFSRLSLEKLATIVNGATYTAASGTAGTATDAKLVVKSNAGLSCADNARLLILKPIIGNAVATDSAQWLFFPKAYPTDTDFEQLFDAGDTQRVFNTVFNAYPDAEGIFWHIGGLDAAESIVNGS